MPFRKLPQTDVARVRAFNLLTKAYKVYVVDVTEETLKVRAIDITTYDAAKLTGGRFSTEVDERGFALSAQNEATVLKDASLLALQKVTSHFIIVMNLAIDRGKYSASIRPAYGLDAGQEDLPPLTREADIYDWAIKIIAGETHRIAGGGVPMQNPSLADVQAALDAYNPLREEQLRKKSGYDKEQEDVANMRAEIDELIKDAWDQIEFYFRKDEPSSLRRKARAWGVEYASRPGEEPEPEPIVFTGNVDPGENKLIMEGGFDVNTLFIIKNTGTVPLRFFSAMSPADPLPGTFVTIDPGIESEVWATELGAESNTFLIANNSAEEVLGSYQVVVGNPE